MQINSQKYNLFLINSQYTAYYIIILFYINIIYLDNNTSS